MKRRIFLGSLGATLLGTGFTASADSGNSESDIHVLRAEVVNSEQFHDVFKGGLSRQQLTLHRVRDRTFDPHSIRVEARGEPVGYLAPVCSEVLAALMDHGMEAYARAVTSGASGAPIVVDVFLQGMHARLRNAKLS